MLARPVQHLKLNFKVVNWSTTNGIVFLVLSLQKLFYRICRPFSIVPLHRHTHIDNRRHHHLEYMANGKRAWSHLCVCVNLYATVPLTEEEDSITTAAHISSFWLSCWKTWIVCSCFQTHTEWANELRDSATSCERSCIAMVSLSLTHTHDRQSQRFIALGHLFWLASLLCVCYVHVGVF